MPRTLSIAAVIWAVATSSAAPASAQTLVGGRVAVPTGGGGGEVSIGGQSFDLSDDGGNALEGLVLMSADDRLRFGGLFQLTLKRKGEFDDSEASPRSFGFKMGKMVALDGVVEYDVYEATTRRGAGWAVHVVGVAGLSVYFPADQLRSALRELGDDGTKVGFNFGWGVGASTDLGLGYALRAELLSYSERVDFADVAGHTFGMRTTRYLLAMGIVFPLYSDSGMPSGPSGP